MTISRKELPIYLLVAFVLPVAVWAQTDTVATNTASELVSESEWYTTERLSGDVTNGDFVVGPGRTELNLQPGDTETILISVANRISDERTFKFEVVDITGSTDGGSALDLVKEGERGPYSIIDYIRFPEEEITLQLGDRARVPVTIALPPDAEPGGYYGSILVSTIQVGQTDEVTVPRNPIIARVGSHLFLTVGGEQELAGKTTGIETVPSTNWYREGPINLGITYDNTGSVHVNPYGEVKITNILGEQVGYVELEPWFVLPKSLRTRELSWDREFLFGRYSVEANINRGYDDVIDTVTTSFWVIPYQFIAGLFAVLFIGFLLIRLFFRTFEFKRK